jgi:hypothetical protein
MIAEFDSLERVSSHRIVPLHRSVRGRPKLAHFISACQNHAALRANRWAFPRDTTAPIQSNPGPIWANQFPNRYLRPMTSEAVSAVTSPAALPADLQQFDAAYRGTFPGSAKR